jgi:predicted nucleic acid-binding Zn ribbon protein
VIFRGSGFYATDYRSDEYRKKSREDNTPAEKEKKSSSKET